MYLNHPGHAISVCYPPGRYNELPPRKERLQLFVHVDIMNPIYWDKITVSVCACIRPNEEAPTCSQCRVWVNNLLQSPPAAGARIS